MWLIRSKLECFDELKELLFRIRRQCIVSCGHLCGHSCHQLWTPALATGSEHGAPAGRKSRLPSRDDASRGEDVVAGEGRVRLRQPDEVQGTQKLLPLRPGRSTSSGGVLPLSFPSRLQRDAGGIVLSVPSLVLFVVFSNGYFHYLLFAPALSKCLFTIMLFVRS